MTTQAVPDGTPNPIARLNNVSRPVQLAVAFLSPLAINLIIYGIGLALGAELTRDNPPEDIVIPEVVTGSVVPIILAFILGRLLERFVSKPGLATRIFTVIVGVGFLASWITVFSSDLSTGSVLTLSPMHFTVPFAALLVAPRR